MWKRALGWIGRKRSRATLPATVAAPGPSPVLPTAPGGTTPAAMPVTVAPTPAQRHQKTPIVVLGSMVLALLLTGAVWVALSVTNEQKERHAALTTKERPPTAPARQWWQTPTLPPGADLRVKLSAGEWSDGICPVYRPMVTLSDHTGWSVEVLRPDNIITKFEIRKGDISHHEIGSFVCFRVRPQEPSVISIRVSPTLLPTGRS